MVRKERLELSHLAAPEPKSGASTNFATSAFFAVASCFSGFLNQAKSSRIKDGAEGET